MKNIVIVLAVITLSACTGKEIVNLPDPGRITEVKNTEITIKKIGNSTIQYVGDNATKTCVAITERASFFHSNAVAITAMPPEACGYSEKEVKVSVVSLPKPLPPVQAVPPVQASKKPVQPNASLPNCTAICNKP